LFCSYLSSSHIILLPFTLDPIITPDHCIHHFLFVILSYVPFALHHLLRFPLALLLGTHLDVNDVFLHVPFHVLPVESLTTSKTLRTSSIQLSSSLFPFKWSAFKTLSLNYISNKALLLSTSFFLLYSISPPPIFSHFILLCSLYL
jgi:hypothetical protein